MPVYERAKQSIERTWDRVRSDRGDVSIWMLLWVPVLVLGFSTVVDYGGAVRTRAFASDAALGASQAGAIEVQTVTGGGAQLRQPEALAAAQAYVAAIDVPERTSITATYAVSPTEVAVTVTAVYDPVFLAGIDKSFTRTELAEVVSGQ